MTVPAKEIAARKRLGEVIAECQKYPHRLSVWEKGFLQTLERIHLNGGSVLSLTDVQDSVFYRLEQKIFS
jgi:hypothetical protein